MSTDPFLLPLYQRFSGLIQKSGLGGLTRHYMNQGYRFSVLDPRQGSKGSVTSPQLKATWVDLADLDEHGPYPEEVVFITIILHELGHYEAMIRGLDYVNEELAWQIAEELCPFALPEGWHEIKAQSLATYRPRQLGEPLVKLAIKKLCVIKQCPDCGCARLLTSPETYGNGPNNPGREIVCCNQCKSQFCIAWGNGQAVSVHRWVLVPDSQ